MVKHKTDKNQKRTYQELGTDDEDLQKIIPKTYQELVCGSFVRWLVGFGGSFGFVVVCFGWVDLVQVLVRFEF